MCTCIEEEREERKLNLPAHLLENISKGTSLAFYSSLVSAHLFSHFPVSLLCWEVSEDTQDACEMVADTLGAYVLFLYVL